MAQPIERKLEIAMRQLLMMTGICHITTLELPLCHMKEQHAQKLAGVLRQCRELLHLNLCDNKMEAAGAERLPGVLRQCAALAHLDLCRNDIGARGAESLARVLGTALTHLDLSWNDIGPDGAE